MFNVEKYDAMRGKVEFSFTYDLWKVINTIVAVLLVGVALGVIYLLVNAIASFFSWFITGGWMWLLGILGVILAVLLLYLLGKKAKTVKWRKPKGNWWKWLLAILVLLLLLLLCFRSCGGAKEEPLANEEGITVVEKNVDCLWYYTKGKEAKYYNGEPAKGIDPEEIRDNEILKELDYLKPEVLEKLSFEQKAVVLAYAMHNGKYGFRVSPFVAALNNGASPAEAEKYLYFVNDKGKEKGNGEQAKYFFWVLKGIWSGKLEMKELSSCPAMSHKDIPLNELYDEAGQPVYEGNIQRLHKANGNKTPNEMRAQFE